MKTKRFNHHAGALCGAFGLLMMAAAVAGDPVKVYLLGGQSNMVGSGKPAELSGVHAKPQEDVKFWQGNTWAALAWTLSNRGRRVVAVSDTHRAVQSCILHLVGTTRKRTRDT